MRQSTNKEYLKLVYQLALQYKDTDKTHNEIMFNVFKELVELFKQRNKRYPVSTDFKHDNLLPTARMIERNYGGLKKFRADIGLEVTNYTEGEVRVKKAKEAMDRSREYEHELFIKLFKKLNRPSEGIIIEREPLISSYDPEIEVYGYRRADIAINDYTKGQRTSTYIDFFYASSPHSFYGCVNLKRKKIKNLVDLKDIIFVSVNPELTKEMVAAIKIPVDSPRVLSYEEFITEFDLK